MSNVQKTTKLLSSLALFKELYNEEKNSYQIIKAFLNNIINNKRLYIFDVVEITNLLNSTYEFEIPTAVVSSVLSRMTNILRKDGICYVDQETIMMIKNLDGKIEENEKATNSIISQLISYVETNRNIKITGKRKHSLQDAFCLFLLNESCEHEYNDLISAFIISKISDTDFVTKLEDIKEGVILYSALTHDFDNFDKESWKKVLVIYADVEIFFNFAGYNGELYKTFAIDFFDLIKELNQKSESNIIQVKYFKETKREIDGFFTKAKFLLEGSEPINPSNTAMNSIINGCSQASDILDKKFEFYKLLDDFNIIEDDCNDYYLLENHKYNIINEELLHSLSESYKDSDTILKIINYISILRKGNMAKELKDAEYLFLTGTSETLKIARDYRVKDKNLYQYAINLFRITEEIWHILNKGFGTTSYPKSFSIIAKSQTIISTLIRNNVTEKYFEMQDEMRKGKLTEEDAIARLIYLREHSIKPEDINNSVIDETLNLLNNDSLNKFIEEQSIRNKMVSQLNNQIDEMGTEIKEKGEIISSSSRILTKILDEKKLALADNKDKLKKTMSRIKLYQVLGKIILIFIFITYYKIGYLNQVQMSKGINVFFYYIFLSMPLLISFIFVLFSKKKYDTLNVILSIDKWIEKKVLGLKKNLINTIESIEREIKDIELEIIKSNSFS